MALTIGRGVSARPSIFVLTGRPSIGKTFLCSSLPEVFFIPTENPAIKGADPRYVDRILTFKPNPRPNSWGELLTMLRELRNGGAKANGVRHLVIDSLTGLEKMWTREVCKRESIAHLDAKEFKTAFTATSALQQTLRDELEAFADQHVCHVWIIAHSSEGQEATETGDTFTKWDIAFEGTGNALAQMRRQWRAWPDYLFFLDWSARVKKGSIGKKQIGEYDARILRTVETPWCFAKSRTMLPPKLPATWPDLERALRTASPASPAKLAAQIAELAADMAPEDKASIEAQVAEANGNAQALATVLSRAQGIAVTRDEDAPAAPPVEPEREQEPGGFVDEADTEPPPAGVDTDREHPATQSVDTFRGFIASAPDVGGVLIMLPELRERFSGVELDEILARAYARAIELAATTEHLKAIVPELDADCRARRVRDDSKGILTQVYGAKRREIGKAAA